MQSFIALADPTRRRIVELLAERERTAGQLVAEFSMSAPAISQHLKVLREAGLVTSRVDGQRRIQAIDGTGLREIERWLSETRRLWEARCDGDPPPPLAAQGEPTTREAEPSPETAGTDEPFPPVHLL